MGKEEVSRNNPPCRGCKERNLGCHANCKRYLKWRDLRDSILQEKKKNIAVNDAYQDIRYAYVNKLKKNKNLPK